MARLQSSSSFDKWLKLSLNYFKKKEAQAMSRANESGTLLADAQSWRKVSIPVASKEMIFSMFWKHIRGGVKRNQDYEIWRIFYELDEFLEFYIAAMGRYPRMNCLAYNDGRSRKVCTFVAPYGYVNETVSETTVAQYADYFKDNEMTCLFFDCTPEGSEQLLAYASGSASKAFLVFVLEKRLPVIDRTFR